jgi:uncharacterized membrane protein
MSQMLHFQVLLLALGVGVIAGLRTFTAPTVVAWAAVLHWINLSGTWASWVGNLITAIVFSVLALGELFLDKQPKTPPRTAPPSFIGRLLFGGFSGAVVGTAWAVTWSALGAGVLGAVIGTLVGYQVRAKLSGSFGRDLPAALIEDVVAVGGGFALAALTAAL